MADESEKPGQEPNLELPSLLGFGRKKKRKDEVAQPEAVTEVLPAHEPVTEDLPTDAGPLAADPVAEPRGGLAPAVEKPKRHPPMPPPSTTSIAPEPPPLHAEEPQPAAVEPVVVEPVVGRPLFAPAAETAPSYQDYSPVIEEPAGEVAAPAARSSASLSLPAINPRAAVFVTGVLVGLIGVLLAFLAARGCETVRGVGSCGGIGLFALLGILVIQVLLGAAVLKAWRVFDPVSTSFLGIGLVAVFALLFLLSSLESVWMLLVIPVLSGLAYLFSWWVTTAFVEDADRT